MNPTKLFILRALKAANGTPIPESVLTRAARDAVFPQPLKSQVDDAREELSNDNYILGIKDDVAGETVWSLTGKGRNRAQEL
jgi:hypothetical protein